MWADDFFFSFSFFSFFPFLSLPFFLFFNYFNWLHLQKIAVPIPSVHTKIACTLKLKSERAHARLCGQ